MVNVGVIGLGPQWESGYRAALERLRSRISVRAVYNAVESRAAQMAAVWKADPADGIRALLERPDVRAVLVFDTAWHGSLPFEFVLASRKPAFLSLWPDMDRSMVGQLAEQTRAESLTLIPAFPRRYMPATARLRELIATRIGRPLRIRIQTGCPEPAPPARPEAAGMSRQKHEPEAPARSATGMSDPLGCRPLLHVFDWCRQVVRTSPSSATATPAESPEAAWAGVRRIEVSYRAPKEGSKCHVEIEVGALRAEGELSENVAVDGPPLRIDVEAERGSATLTGPCTIDWSAGGDSSRESLTTERSEFEVMLDLFCRRVVGGLIPVADFGDIARGLALWSACEESLRTGGPVALKMRQG